MTNKNIYYKIFEKKCAVVGKLYLPARQEMVSALIAAGITIDLEKLTRIKIKN